MEGNDNISAAISALHYNEQFCINWRAEAWKILGEPADTVLVKHTVLLRFFETSASRTDAQKNAQL